MTIFVILAAILTLTVFAIILPPLWRSQSVDEANFAQRNVSIARHRIRELDEQLQLGFLSQTLYEEQVSELEQSLGDDLELDEAKTAAHRGRWLVYALALVIPLLSGTLYLSLGVPQAIDPVENVTPLADIPNSDEINKMVEGLAAKMQADPSDGEGWLMLGRSYKVLQQYPKAVDAFAKAYNLLGNKPDVMLQYADALAFAEGERITGKSAELIFKALEIEPDNLNGLWLGGMAKAQAGDFVSAMVFWQKLESLLPPGSEAQKEAQGLVAKIKKQIPKEQLEQLANAAQGVPVGIKVEVSLDKKLQKAVAANDTVFIYAQAHSGPKMPLAIVKKQVAELPLAVTLDDSMAMMPAMKLSAFPTVRLLARVSKSGNAMPQAGDLIGRVEEVQQANQKTYKIVINDKVK